MITHLTVSDIQVIKWAKRESITVNERKRGEIIYVGWKGKDTETNLRAARLVRIFALPKCITSCF